MKKMKFWVWKMFHRKVVHCRHFCRACKYYGDTEYNADGSIREYSVKE